MNRKCEYINFCATFNPIADVTKKFINNSQKLLVDDFCTPNILPVPDVLPDDVPRIVTSSNGKHSQIILSKINCSLTTKFDENFSGDLAKCINYFEEKVTTVSDIVNTLNDDSTLVLNFLGITTGLIFDNEEALHLLQNNITKIQVEDICDIDLQITRIVEERYYINIRISNARLFNKVVNTLSCGFLANEYHNGIRVTIDVNNRYAFSKGITKTKKCELDEIKKIKELTENTINSLPDIFGKEVFSE